MADFNVEDYKIQKTPMTYGDAVDGLENIIKFLEGTHKNHFILGAARRLLDDANKEDPNKEANVFISDFVENFGSPEMMTKLEDTCDWTTNGSNNNFYSMRDVPTAESAKSKFRALCEQEIEKIKCID